MHKIKLNELSILRYMLLLYLKGKVKVIKIIKVMRNASHNLCCWLNTTVKGRNKISEIIKYP